MKRVSVFLLVTTVFVAGVVVGTSASGDRATAKGASLRQQLKDVRQDLANVEKRLEDIDNRSLYDLPAGGFQCPSTEKIVQGDPQELRTEYEWTRRYLNTARKFAFTFAWGPNRHGAPPFTQPKYFVEWAGAPWGTGESREVAPGDFITCVPDD